MSAGHRAQGRIADRGYQHYEGTRLGPARAFWTMLRAALARALGRGRKVGATTVIKVILLVVPYIPVIIALVARANTGSDAFSYTAFLTSISLLFILLPALIAPDLLCPDRRERVLSLYFASPITKLGYIVAQATALMLVLLLLTLGPLLLYFVGSALLSGSAASYAGDHRADLGHLGLGGALLAAYYGALSLAAATFSDRRAYAAGGYIGALLVTAIASSILARGLRFGGHQNWALLDLQALPVRAARFIFEQAPEEAHLRATPPYLPTVGGWTYLAFTLGAIALALAVALYQYLRLEE